MAVPKVQLFRPDETVKFVEPLPVGPGRLHKLFDGWLTKLVPSEVSGLKGYLVGQWSQPGWPHFGSICSGTDIPAAVCEQWRSWAGDFAGDFERLDMRFEHKFSCELDPKKRGFIRSVHPGVGHIFGDVMDLSGQEAWCFKTGGLTPVPACEVVAAGFPCTDVSHLNPHSRTQANRSCVGHSSMRTGGVFGGILDYLRSQDTKPTVLLLENVMGLSAPPKEGGPSNLDIVGLQLAGLGYHLHAWYLTPKMFGVPQCRQRVWMTAIRTDLVQDLVHNLSEVNDILAELMSRITGWPQSDLNDYLVGPRT